MAPRYEIMADDVSVWESSYRPTKDEIDRTAIYATGRGWNGTELELHCDGLFREWLYPREEALSAETVEDYHKMLDGRTVRR